jgi:hypothetical protein
MQDRSNEASRRREIIPGIGVTGATAIRRDRSGPDARGRPAGRYGRWLQNNDLTPAEAIFIMINDLSCFAA